MADSDVEEDCPGGRSLEYCLHNPCWCAPDGAIRSPRVKRVAWKLMIAELLEEPESGG